MMIYFRRYLDEQKFAFPLGLLGALCAGLGLSTLHTTPRIIASFAGYGLILLSMQKAKPLLTGWALFSLAFLIQSSWLLSHPFSYIIAAWLLLSLLFALPYALCAKLFLSKPPSVARCLLYAALFATLEHLFASLPCGYSFQCAALYLTWSTYPIQLASIIGGIGLSFLAYLSNLLFVHTKHLLPLTLSILLPYLCGALLYIQRTPSIQQAPTFTAAICHLAEKPHVDGSFLPPSTLHEKAWNTIFHCLLPKIHQPVDLILLPEIVAPYSADSPLYRPSNLPPALQDKGLSLLSSLDIAKILSSYFKTPIMLGLEGRDYSPSGEFHSYNSCFFVPPNTDSHARYDKQLLLPFGEYIPYPPLAHLLSYYGIHASFTPGQKATIFTATRRLAPLICYEETFSQYATQAYHLHPDLLACISNDVWYPAVAPLHFELAKLRAAELGIPLIRACNQGISAAIDATGNTLASSALQPRQGPTCLIATIPISSHPSPFALLGERTTVALMLVLAGLVFVGERRSPNPTAKVRHVIW